MQQKQEVKKSKTTFCKIFVHACLGFVPKKYKKKTKKLFISFFFAKGGDKKRELFSYVSLSLFYFTSLFQK
jgi:hypothetical protein